MNEKTINADVTMGGATDVLLAGRYRVVKQLGQGGMGSVWLAEDTKLDGHKVAVKMLPSILISNKRAYNQLKAEAIVSLKLTHPNIATVRAFEENDGNPFLVVDYIDGYTLDDYLAEKGSLSEEETIHILKPIAAALDYAHDEGVVHRDVKPANVIVRKDGRPYILDFGIAREIQETLTRITGKLSSGTVMYMSPEQLQGATPSVAQDVYSFAAMSYECLSGNPPFCRGQIEYQIIHNEVANVLRPGRFADLIMKGLSKDPCLRPLRCGMIICAENGVPFSVNANNNELQNGMHPESPPQDDQDKHVSPMPTKSLVGTSVVILIGMLMILGVLVYILRFFVDQPSAIVKEYSDDSQSSGIVEGSANGYQLIEREEELKPEQLQTSAPANFPNGTRSIYLKALNGDADAQRNLGSMYETGREIPRDQEQAALWYRKAAEQGDVIAQCRLGMMYESGCGVPSSRKLAKFWYRKSAEGGNSWAKKRLGENGWDK